MQELLPLGTIIKLKDSTGLFMIAGYYPIDDSNLAIYTDRDSISFRSGK